MCQYAAYIKLLEGSNWKADTAGLTIMATRLGLHLSNGLLPFFNLLIFFLQFFLIFVFVQSRASGGKLTPDNGRQAWFALEQWAAPMKFELEHFKDIRGLSPGPLLNSLNQSKIVK